MTGDPFTLLRFALAGLFCGLGLIVMLTSALGHLRFPDFYARAHASLAADTVGAGLMLLSLAVVAWDGAITMRLLVLGVVLTALAPARVHAIAVAAHGGGLAPVIGRYKAPRPGDSSIPSSGAQPGGGQMAGGSS